MSVRYEEGEQLREEGEQEKKGRVGRKVDLGWNSSYSRIAARTPDCGLKPDCLKLRIKRFTDSD